MRGIENFLRLLFLSLLLPAGNILLAQGIDPVAPPVKNVLVVFPYHAYLSASILGEEVIREKTSGLIDISLNLYFEYLDLSRFPGTAYRKAVFDFINGKYAGIGLDCILLASKTALDLRIDGEISVAPDAPSVFFDVNEQALDGVGLPASIYGVTASIDHRPTIEWFEGAKGPIRELAVVYGRGPTDGSSSAPVRELLDFLRARGIRYADLSDRPFSAVLDYVSGMRSGSAVLYHLLFQDAAGDRYRPSEALRRLAAASAVPVLVGYDRFVGLGSLGGYTYSIESQASEAVKMMLAILRGERLGKGRVVKGRGNRFVFDHEVARRFGIRVKDLPAGSLLKNRILSFGELYAREILALSAVILVLAVLVVVLSGQTRRLHRARVALADLNADLESQVSLRTSDLSTANHQLREEIAERARAEKSLHEALAERGVLLKELNHRIKNNLQIVLSLIRLSSSEEPNRETAVLKEAAGRIEAIANVHESFDPDDDSLVVSLDDYLNRLAKDAIGMHAGVSRISIETATGSGMSVPMKTAASVGLIVNELLTNAFKYAYPDGSGGPVRIGSSLSADGTLIVQVSDEGVGIDPEAVARPGSLGMGIVNSLAEGLGARLELEAAPGKGTRWTLSFPKSN